MPSSTAHWVQRRDAKQTWRIWLLPAIAELLGGGFAPRNKNVRSARRAISRRSALLNHNQRHSPPARDMKAVRLRHLASSRIEGGNHDRRDIQSIRHGCRNAEASCFRDPAELLHFNQGCCRWATTPNKCGLYQHGICWIPYSGRVCLAKKVS